MAHLGEIHVVLTVTAEHRADLTTGERATTFTPAACPSCGKRTLLATITSLFVLGEMGTTQTWGSPFVPAGAKVACNTVSCGWTGDVRDVPEAGR